MRGNTCLKLEQRGLGGQLAAAQREAQTVAGHGIDKTGRIPRQQQSGTSGRTGLDRERSQ